MSILTKNALTHTFYSKMDILKHVDINIFFIKH
jgi:hypothetical protein